MILKMATDDVSRPPPNSTVVGTFPDMGHPFFKACGVLPAISFEAMGKAQHLGIGDQEQIKAQATYLGDGSQIGVVRSETSDGASFRSDRYAHLRLNLPRPEIGIAQRRQFLLQGMAVAHALLSPNQDATFRMECGCVHCLIYPGAGARIPEGTCSCRRSRR